MYRSFIHIFLFLLLSGLAFGQEYSYVRYTEKDGLAGDVMYSATIDTGGFIWLATKTGVSKFDGTKFTNFTIKEGLPCNEVIEIFADKKGRIWMSPFMHVPVFYEKGNFTKIESGDIPAAVLKSPVRFFADYQDGILIVNQQWDAFYVKDNKVKLLSKIFRNYPTGKINSVGISNNRLYIDDKNFIYKVIGDSCVKFRDSPGKTISLKEMIVGMDEKENIILAKYPRYLDYSQSVRVNDTTTAHQIKDEIFFFDTRNGNFYRKIKFSKFNDCITDEVGNWWILSKTKGLYRIPSFAFHNYINGVSPEVFSITEFNGNIYSGGDHNNLFITSKENNQTTIYKNFERFLKNSENLSSKPVFNRMYASLNYKDNLYIGSDGFLVKLDKMGQAQLGKSIIIKSLDAKNDTLLVATGRGAFLVNANTLKVIDTIWKERCTFGIFYNGNFMLSTLSGLIELKPDRSFVNFSTIHKVFSQPIVSMKKDTEGNLWLATSGEGVVKFFDGKVIRRITTQDGLSSEIATSLFINKNEAWVGTERGLNCIRLIKDTFAIATYSIDDGLPSDHINDVYVDGNIVYVGSDAGLTIFDKTKVQDLSQCRFHILTIRVKDSTYETRAEYSLPYNKNSLSIDYIAISYKSGGKITYLYRLAGLEENWNKTTSTTIRYPAIPSGEYVLEIKAINKFGVESATKKIIINIATPWWETLWFIVLASLIVIGIVWYLINKRYKVINKRKEERRELQKKITDLEQMALRAQMNPHFIFNCLSSIQSFIIKKDIETTNRYLNDFARILRKTLDNGSSQTISIADEIEYLKTYLDLETMRFGDKFKYEIQVDENISADYTLIPNMILQPFVENSIRHGIRYKENNDGFIEISFFQTDQTLTCTIKDNGIGREKAAKFKSQQHIEYQSKGMQITMSRLELLNVENVEKVITEVSDVISENKDVCGTKVVITFPLSIIDKLN